MKDGELRLGLGFTVEVTGFADVDKGQQPLGPRRYVRQSEVKAPANLIAIGDGANWLLPNNPDGILNYEEGTVTAPHNGGANGVLSDAHVEYAKRDRWVDQSNGSRKRWNNDHQPHPETW